MKKAFLSYSHKDEEFVEGLYHKLARDGVDCFFDKESIAWGANWVLELEKGIDECDIIVLVLSPAFCQSEWTKIERTSTIVDDPSGFKKKLRPLLLVPCGDLLPRFLKPIQHIDISTPEKFDKEYPKICLALGGSMAKKIKPADRRKLPPVQELPEKHRMPYRSLGNNFIGRVRDLWEIDDNLRRNKTTVIEGVGVIIGMGGLGKTQLAIEYVHRFGVYYLGGVFWIESERGISTMIDQISHRAGIDIDSILEEKDQLLALWEKLSRFKPVLIVLDNFPEDEPIQPWLPSAVSIHTLITTRRRDLDKYSSVYLDLMTIKESFKLLNSGPRKFGQDAKILVETLGGLPLAIELTRNFLNLRPDLTVESLLQEMKKLGEIKTLTIFAKKYADELPTGHTKEIVATFQMSWDLASPTSKALLQAMSLLAPIPVPRRLLRKIFDIPSESTLENPLDEAISELAKNLSLIELDEENDPWMHRLISAFAKTTLNENNYLYEKIVNTVIDEMSRVSDDKDIQSFRQLEKIVPHAEMLLSSEFIKSNKVLDISNYLRWHYKKWGKYRLAETYGRKALYLSEKNFDPGHPSIATSQSNLALVLKDLGELEEARALLRKALESGEKNFDQGHPKIATRQSNLALVLKDLGELEEARALLRKALESDEKNFDPGHPSIATRQSNLALVLKDLGELEEAKRLAKLAYNAFLNLFGHKHPHTKIAKKNLESM